MRKIRCGNCESGCDLSMLTVLFSQWVGVVSVGTLCYYRVTICS